MEATPFGIELRPLSQQVRAAASALQSPAAKPVEIIRCAVKIAKERFQLDFHDGIHGVGHWSRVWHHGKTLADALDVNPRIPAWFAFLHDSCRENDSQDEHHGSRAADFALALRDEGLIRLDASEFDQLAYAMVEHSNGKTEAHRAVQVCWDADRLDLARAGIAPDPQYLCTRPAKESEVIQRAVAMSLRCRRSDFTFDDEIEAPRSMRPGF